MELRPRCDSSGFFAPYSGRENLPHDGHHDRDGVAPFRRHGAMDGVGTRHRAAANPGELMSSYALLGYLTGHS